MQGGWFMFWFAWTLLDNRSVVLLVAYLSGIIKVFQQLFPAVWEKCEKGGSCGEGLDADMQTLQILCNKH